MLKAVQKFVDKKSAKQSEIIRLLGIFVVTYSVPPSELKKLTKKLDRPEFIEKISSNMHETLEREADFISEEDLETFEARNETSPYLRVQPLIARVVEQAELCQLDQSVYRFAGDKPVDMQVERRTMMQQSVLSDRNTKKS